MTDFLQSEDAEVIRTQYALMIADLELIEDFSEARVLLEVYRDDTTDCLEGCNKGIRREKLCYLKNLLKAKDYEFSKNEIDILNQKVMFARRFNGFFGILEKIVTEDNYMEVGNLAKFTNAKYLSNLGYFDELHRINDLASSGIGYWGCEVNDQDAFEVFFNEEVKRLAPNDRKSQVIVEKTKK